MLMMAIQYRRMISGSYSDNHGDSRFLAWNILGYHYLEYLKVTGNSVCHQQVSLGILIYMCTLLSSSDIDGDDHGWSGTVGDGHFSARV